MRRAWFVLAFALSALPLAGQVSAQSAGLQVLRTIPRDSAFANTEISIIFDRPIAATIERIPDPAPLFSIEPHVPGRLAWRDNTTLRFIPATALTPGTRYRVRVTNTFPASDGTRLAAPYEYSFTVARARLLGAATYITYDSAPSFAPHVRVLAIYNGPVADSLRSPRMELKGPCATSRPIPLSVAARRAVTSTDRDTVLPRANITPQPAAEPAWTVVELREAAAVPKGCQGTIRLPKVAGLTGSPEYEQAVNIIGDLQLRTVDAYTPRGPVTLMFSSPVAPAEISRHLRIVPEGGGTAVPFSVRMSDNAFSEWALWTSLTPRTGFDLVIDTAFRDVAGRPFTGPARAWLQTTGVIPSIEYSGGDHIIPAGESASLIIRHTNVDSLLILAKPVSANDIVRPGYDPRGVIDSIARDFATGATTYTVATRPVARDTPEETSILLGPVARALGTNFLAVMVKDARTRSDPTVRGPIANVQLTELGIHANVTELGGWAWVTHLATGRPVSGVRVSLLTRDGGSVASALTTPDGLAHLELSASARAGYSSTMSDADAARRYGVILHADASARTATRGSTTGQGTLSYGRVAILASHAEPPFMGVLLTDRGIYRAGETVHANVVVRRDRAALGIPPGSSDTLQLLARAAFDNDKVLHEGTTRLSVTGSASRSIALPGDLALGRYEIVARLRYLGRWETIASADFHVAEYRAPEFLMTMRADTAARVAGAPTYADIEGRYFSGGPMARLPISVSSAFSEVSGHEIGIPHAENEIIGDGGYYSHRPGGLPAQHFGMVAVLDSAGRFRHRFATPLLPAAYPMRFQLFGGITDASNVGGVAGSSAILYPASIAIAVTRPSESSHAGTPERFRIRVLRLDGSPAPGARVAGTLSYLRDPVYPGVSSDSQMPVPPSPADTVSRCEVVSGVGEVECVLTPPAIATYEVHFRASDESGRVTLTSFVHRAYLRPDFLSTARQRSLAVGTTDSVQAPGDTVHITFESPFPSAEAWIVVERSWRVLDQRVVTVQRGSNRIPIPLAARHAPAVLVSVALVPRDTTGNADGTVIQTGSVNIQVSPRAHFLDVHVAPRRTQYRPGDSATIAVRVRDPSAIGVASSVTLWMVDDAVLALTDWSTPNVFEQLFPPNAEWIYARGSRLVRPDQMTTVQLRSASGDAGARTPPRGSFVLGGVLSQAMTQVRSDFAYRSVFNTTPVHLSTVRTDRQGNASVTVRLPDNLTTFRIVALAAAEGDRFGSGDTSIVIAKPLMARAAMPRFVRAGDTVHVGAVAQTRDATALTVGVFAEARGAAPTGSISRTVALANAVGTSVRFPFLVDRGDSATFRVAAAAPADSDAVESRIPIRPDFHRRAHASVGTLRDTMTAVLRLPAGIDPARSRLVVSAGSTTIAPIRWAYEHLRAAPFWFTDCIVSQGLAIISLLRAEQALGITKNVAEHDRLREELRRSLRFLADRQRWDGSFGLVHTEVPSQWLTARAGLMVLAARDAGIAVPNNMLERIASSVADDMGSDSALAIEANRDTLGLRAYQLDFLDRYGKPNPAMVRSLANRMAALRWEDRVLMASLLARQGDSAQARATLADAWTGVLIVGNRIEIPDSLTWSAVWYSRMRPPTRLLLVTLELDPANSKLGALAELVARVGQAERGWAWSNTDYGEAAVALAAIARAQSSARARRIQVTSGGRTIFDGDASALSSNNAEIPLSGLLGAELDGARELRVRLASVSGTQPIFFSVTVHEVPLTRPVTPDIAGVAVERWYERLDDGRPVTSVTAGDLVRVRMRITVPADRFFLALEDPLPAGLEAIDLSLKTSETLAPFLRSTPTADSVRAEQPAPLWQMALHGTWREGWWSPWDHRELRDDRVIFFARMLWAGTYTASYVARAVTPGTFIAPPAHAEELNNPALQGRTGGGTFRVVER